MRIGKLRKQFGLDLLHELDVAPVAPAARLERTNSGSTESSHSFVPVDKRDSIGFGMVDGPE